MICIRYVLESLNKRDTQKWVSYQIKMERRMRWKSPVR